jgi:DNA-binding response OmpR family regulator
MRILVIEDDDAVSAAIRRALLLAGYEIIQAQNGQEGLWRAQNDVPDAIVLDLGLPDIDGMRVCETLRSSGNRVPILMLTARDAVEDRVAGLDCGADDYLVKPFVEEELLARIAAILRRADRPMVGIVEAGALRIDLAGRSVSYNGKPVVLGATEFRLLEFLARNAGIALSRTQIVERIWDYDFEGSSNIVDVYVSQLRRKLKALGASGVIETVWGIGYRLKAG